MNDGDKKGRKMFDWFRRLFGEGTIRAEFICTDGSKGSLKVPYTGDISTFSESELHRQVKYELWAKHGKELQSLTKIQIMEKP